MKRFLTYVTVFISPLLFSGICLEILVRKIPNDYLYKKNYLDKYSKNIETLFLGSSHVYYGINPEYVKSKSFNAAYISQSLDYDFAIFKKYDKRWDSLRSIAIAVDYFSLYKNLETGIEAWRMKNYSIYYNIHNSRGIENNTEIFSNSLKVNLKRLYGHYFKNMSSVTCSELGWGTGYNSKDTQGLTMSGQQAAIRHFAESQKYFNENVETLRSIIVFAKERGIRVLLFTSPAYKTYVQHLDSTQLHRTVDTLDKLANSYQNVSYFNLLTDSIFKATDFYDADHLNDIGAKKLTIKIDSLLAVQKGI